MPILSSTFLNMVEMSSTNKYKIKFKTKSLKTQDVDHKQDVNLKQYKCLVFYPCVFCI